MKIEVGSEWVSNTDKRFTILAVDEDKLFIKYHDGEHMIISYEGLRVFCKPAHKRRFVWMNVYSDYVTCHISKSVADQHKYILGDSSNFLFQQEFEIIDPRDEGDD